MPRTGYINLTLPKSIRDRLDRVARKNNRTMTAQIEAMLGGANGGAGSKSTKSSAGGAKKKSAKKRKR